VTLEADYPGWIRRFDQALKRMVKTSENACSPRDFEFVVEISFDSI
jgi:hypothetical protein